jgi:hypothetical protein
MYQLITVFSGGSRLKDKLHKTFDIIVLSFFKLWFCGVSEASARQSAT